MSFQTCEVLFDLSGIVTPQLLYDSLLFLPEVEEKPVKENTPVPPPFGVLVAEPYSWKSLVTGQPCLRIKTTGVKAAVMTLPPG